MIERTFAAVEELFALPLDDKLALTADEGFTGYIPVSGSLLRNSYVGTNPKPDLTETMNFMRDFPPDNPYRIAGRQMMGPNKWPSELPWLRPIMSEYMTASIRLAYKLLPIYARAWAQRGTISTINSMIRASIAALGIIRRCRRAKTSSGSARTPT